MICSPMLLINFSRFFTSLTSQSFHVFLETRSILLLTKYDKIISEDEEKHTQKQVFQWIEQNTTKIKADFYIYSTCKFDFWFRWTFFKVRKQVPRSAWSQRWLCPFKQLRIEAWKSQDFNGVWTRDLAIPVRRFDWAMKPMTLGAGYLWILMSPWRIDLKWYMKCFIYMKWNISCITSQLWHC